MAITAITFSFHVMSWSYFHRCHNNVESLLSPLLLLPLLSTLSPLSLVSPLSLKLLLSQLIILITVRIVIFESVILALPCEHPPYSNRNSQRDYSHICNYTHDFYFFTVITATTVTRTYSPLRGFTFS